MTALSRCEKLASLYGDLLGDLPAVDRHNQFRLVCEGAGDTRPSDPSLAAFYTSFERIRQIMSQRECGPEFNEWLAAYLSYCVNQDQAQDTAAEEETGPKQSGEWTQRWDALEPWMQGDVKERLEMFVSVLEEGRALLLLDRTCPCEYFKKSWGKHFHMVIVHDLTEAATAELKSKLAAIPTRPDHLGHFVWTLDWRPRTPDMTHEWLTAFGIEVPWRSMFGIVEAAVEPVKPKVPVFAPANCRCTYATAEVPA